MLDRLRALWATEPTRVTTLLVAIVVFAAAKLGLVIDTQNVGEALALLLPILLGGELVRAQVTPNPGPIGPPSDALLPPEVLDQPGPDEIDARI